MSSLNKCMLIGRLGNDPDIRKTKQGTSVANMSLATSDRYKDENGEWKEATEWHRIVAWDKLADIAEEYLTKGSQVYVEGPIKTKKWQDKDGRDRYTTEITALKLTMLGSSSGSPDQAGGRSQPQPAGGQKSVFDDDLDIDDELPF